MFNEKDILNDVFSDLGIKDEDEILEDDDEEILDDEDVEETEEEELLEDESEDEEDEPEKEVDKSPLGDLEFNAIKKKPTQEEKQAYAFEQLRKENKQRKEELDKLNDIAQMYGYGSHKEMVDALEKDAMTKKAKSQNIDPVFYEELQKTKKQLETLTKQREEDVQRNKVVEITTRIDSFLKEKGLGDKEKTELITKLEDDGFTIDSLVNIKNYKQFFSGYMIETITEKEKQKVLEKESKKKNLQEDKLSDTRSNEATFDMDKIIANLLKNSGSTRY